MAKALILGVAVSLLICSVATTPQGAAAQTAGAAPDQTLASSPVQHAATAALMEGIALMNASGGAVVILDVNTGQIMALASVGREDGSAEVPWHRAINNVQEVGGVMAVFAVAQALEEGLITETTQIETPPNLSVAGFEFRDYGANTASMTPAEIFNSASHVGMAQIGRIIGAERQQAFLGRLGLLELHPLERTYPTETGTVRPDRWEELSAMTVAAGHGLSASPLQVAEAYATLVNGGTRVHASLQPDGGIGERVLSVGTSAVVRAMLRDFVVTGTASLADVPGYSVGGRSGASDLRLATGGFTEDQFVVTFAAIFPSDLPRYVVVAQLENPVYLSPEGEERRSAGWTVVSVTGQIIERWPNNKIPTD